MFKHINAIKDPTNCQGYPPAVISLKKTKQIDFHLPDKKKSDPGVALACSLIPCPAEDLAPSAPGSDADVRKLLRNLDRSRPVIILAHGDRSWRNQMLLCNLSSELSSILMCHTLRFDFSANGHSGPFKGEDEDKHKWRYADIDREYEDLCRIVDFIKEDLKMEVYCMVGHSQGSNAVLRYASEHDKPADHQHRNDTVYVNLAGCYFGHEEHTLDDVFDEDTSPEKRAEYAKTGRSTLELKGGRGFVVTKEDVEKREKQDIDEMIKSIKHSHVYTMHGDKDKDVPMSNAHKFKEVLPGENCWTKIVEDADHSFSNVKHVNFLLIKIEWFVRYYTTPAVTDGSVTPWFLQKPGEIYNH
eukprot:CAMPEP_0197233852 /NCGR_PEP_ID=MMETSP1429-20130617/1795_1 /TAXON_ID=49237 /ORGANISM="Chaetoceros  sp., Strain UNC1202" /LENGTH=356 /DNA_ID=CAMNT_0042692163 /DNA_START=64 /DNA_END=1134 /DNA_ORIENTATION=-